MKCFSISVRAGIRGDKGSPPQAQKVHFNEILNLNHNHFENFWMAISHETPLIFPRRFSQMLDGIPELYVRNCRI